LINTEVIKN